MTSRARRSSLVGGDQDAEHVSPAVRRADANTVDLSLIAAAGNRAVGGLLAQRSVRDDMIAKYQVELTNGSWDAAATTLGGFNEPDIDRMLRDRTQPFQLSNVRLAALRIVPGGHTRIIDRIDALAAKRAPKPGQETPAWRILFAQCMEHGDFEQAATVLRGLFQKSDKAATAAVAAVRSKGKPDLAKLDVLKQRAIAMWGAGAAFISGLVDPILGPVLAVKASTEGNVAHNVATKNWAALGPLMDKMPPTEQLFTACRIRRADVAAAKTAAVAGGHADPYASMSSAALGVADELFLRALSWPLDQLIAAFEHRWACDVAGMWGRGSLTQTWQQLNRLPPEHVKQGTAITLLTGIEGQVSYEGSKKVTVAQGGSDLPGSVRHEVGHALHESQPTLVDSWLATMGFRSMGDEVKALIDAFGGYPSTYVDDKGRAKPFEDSDQDMLEFALVNHTSTKDTFKAGAELPNPTGKARVDRLWAAMPVALRRCLELSANEWFVNFDRFPKRMFWNHYYGVAYSMSPKVIAVVQATGDTYTAMSDKEFFANCYANFFAPGKGKGSGPQSFGGTLPPDVQAWFRANFLPPTAAAPRKSKAGKK